VKISPGASNRLSKIMLWGWPDMPRTVTLLGNLGPGEKGTAKEHVLVLRRMLTLWFLIVSTTQCSSVLMVATGAWMGSPRTHHCLDGCAPNSANSQEQHALQCFPLKMGQGLRGAFCGLWGCSLMKWPSCPHL
jgi:hypothetical protein